MPKPVARQFQKRKCEIREIKPDGTIIGYGSVFNIVDSYGSRIAPGAFSKTLTDRNTPVRMFWQHDSNQPIGIFTELTEDSYGLHFVGQLNMDVQQGREAYALLKQGAMDGMSIGFYSIIDESDQTTGIRTIKEVQLVEISVVTWPANPAAVVTEVKSLRDAFDLLTEEQRVETFAFINKFNSPPPSTEEPQPEVIATTDEQHSDEEEAGPTPTEEPQSDEELLHSLGQLSRAMKDAAKTFGSQK